MKHYCNARELVQAGGHYEQHQCIKDRGHSGPHTDGRFTWTTPDAGTSPRSTRGS